MMSMGYAGGVQHIGTQESINEGLPTVEEGNEEEETPDVQVEKKSEEKGGLTEVDDMENLTPIAKKHFGSKKRTKTTPMGQRGPRPHVEKTKKLVIKLKSKGVEKIKPVSLEKEKRTVDLNLDVQPDENDENDEEDVQEASGESSSSGDTSLSSDRSDDNEANGVERKELQIEHQMRHSFVRAKLADVKGFRHEDQSNLKCLPYPLSMFAQWSKAMDQNKVRPGKFEFEDRYRDCGADLIFYQAGMGTYLEPNTTSVPDWNKFDPEELGILEEVALRFLVADGIVAVVHGDTLYHNKIMYDTWRYDGSPWCILESFVIWNDSPSYEGTKEVMVTITLPLE